MARSILSGKRLQIDKANSTMVIFSAVAAFVIIFSLVASRALLSQRSYQSRVIAEKTKALNQLKANNQAAQQLVASYRAFIDEPTNIISGTSNGNGDRDGDNAKIVLDALPSKYDFPALATSLEKILTDQNISIVSITGIDDELNQSAAQTAKSTEPIEMPFEVGINSTFEATQALIDVFQRSIRPLYITKIDLTGLDNQLEVTISAKTYYQPEKLINIQTKGVQ